MTFRTDTKLPLRRNVDLSKFTTMHVGGPANYFIDPTTEEELSQAIEFARQEKLPHLLLGKGSNLIFSDAGYSGVVISMNRFQQNQIIFDSNEPIVQCSAGVQLYRFALACRDHSLGGMEFLSTIPGTVGGALAMNAGFSRHPGQKNETSDILESATILNDDGKRQVYIKKELDFSYRTSSLKGKIILSGTFRLWRRRSEDVEKEIRLNFDYRLKEQDVRFPSSGSIFKNPVGVGKSAGKIIDELGLKGARVGDAMISNAHANYMINVGKAKCDDFKQLIELIQKKVFDSTGITLETEVIIL